MTNFKQKKEELVNEFNQNSQTLFQLQKRQNEIIGGLKIIEDIEKTGKEAKEKKEKVEEKK